MVKKIISGIILAAALLNTVQAQSRRSWINIDYLWVGEYHPEVVTPFSFAGNPAAIANTKGFSASGFAEKRYMLEGLDLFAAAAAYVLDKSAAAVSLKYFGNTDYNEMNIAAHYGRSFGKIGIGISFCYDALSINPVEKQSAITVGVSSVWKLSENCYAAVQAKDISLLKQKSTGKASHYRFGFGYRVAPKINTGIEFFKEELRPPQFILNIQYRFEEKYFARIGFISGAPELFAGAGWLHRNIKIEIIARQHSQLGITPGILLTYQNTGK